MRKSRSTEEQMVAILREADKAPVQDVAKKHGISDQTLYIWRKKFGAMDVADAKRLKQLEEADRPDASQWMTLATAATKVGAMLSSA